MEAVRAKMLGNSGIPVPRIRLVNNNSDDSSDDELSSSMFSLDSATVHELISKCHSMGDVSTGSDSVFLPGPASFIPSYKNHPESLHVTPPPPPDDMGSVASIFAQSVLSGYLQSHRRSISDAIHAIGCPTGDEEEEDDDLTPVPSDYDDDEEEEQAVGYDDQQQHVLLEVPRHLSFSTMLSPIEENGETPTSESVSLLHDNNGMKSVPSTTDLISASSMEELKEFLMLETLFTN